MHGTERTVAAATGERRRRERGQALVLALGLLAVALAGALVMYNAGQATAERAQLQDAADAAAWSGGLWVARAAYCAAR